MRKLASYSDPVETIKTKALRHLIEADDRIVAFTKEADGVFIYTNSDEWCDDSGAGTFRGDSETAAVRWYRETVRKADPEQVAAERAFNALLTGMLR